MDARARWRKLISGAGSARPLVDIGSSTLTGVHRPAAPGYRYAGRLANPSMGTIPLTVAEGMRLGSDLTRAGFVFDPPVAVDGEFTDAFGVVWLSGDGAPAPLAHPLQDASPARIARHPRPEWPALIQFPGLHEAGSVVVADAPCPGLLDMCFALRDRWRFLEDIASHWRSASALLDWSLETTASAYERLLGALPTPPDIVVYADD